MSAQTKTSPTGDAYGASPIDQSLPKELVDQMQAIFGKHPGYRTSKYDPINDRDTKFGLILYQRTPKAFSWRGHSPHLRKLKRCRSLLISIMLGLLS